MASCVVPKSSLLESLYILKKGGRKEGLATKPSLNDISGTFKKVISYEYILGVHDFYLFPNFKMLSENTFELFKSRAPRNDKLPLCLYHTGIYKKKRV